MFVFQLRHRSSNVNSCSLDVVRRRGAHVRVSEDSLNHHIRHTEMVRVASQSAPRRVPPVLLWQASVTLAGMVSLECATIRLWDLANEPGVFGPQPLRALKLITCLSEGLQAACQVSILHLLGCVLPPKVPGSRFLLVLTGYRRQPGGGAGRSRQGGGFAAFCRSGRASAAFCCLMYILPNKRLAGKFCGSQCSASLNSAKAWSLREVR